MVVDVLHVKLQRGKFLHDCAVGFLRFWNCKLAWSIVARRTSYERHTNQGRHQNFTTWKLLSSNHDEYLICDRILPLMSSYVASDVTASVDQDSIATKKDVEGGIFGHNQPPSSPLIWFATRVDSIEQPGDGEEINRPKTRVPMYFLGKYGVLQEFENYIFVWYQYIGTRAPDAPSAQSRRAQEVVRFAATQLPLSFLRSLT
jgi:hypothetical protein